MADKKQTKADRINIIQTVQTPLGFFVLVVLVVEVILAGIAGINEGLTATITVVGMLLIILSLVAVVAFFAYNRPEALAGNRPPMSESDLDEALTNLMKYHSKEALTIVRAESIDGKLVNSSIVGVNAKALHYYGFRENQADRLIGQPANFLFEILSQWIPRDHFQAFKRDQIRTADDLDRGYEAYARVPMVIDDRHPFKDLHGRRFLPITLAHSKPQIVKGIRVEKVLVGYFDIDEIVKKVPLYSNTYK